MSRQCRPFFSVLIPTYNRKDFLSMAVSSVLNQEFKDFELFVIDDGSTDQSKAMMNHIQDHRCNYVYQNHEGVSSARNKGLRLSQGRFIAFLDSDDKWKPEKLTITHEYIKKYPQSKIFHTEELWYQNGRLKNQLKKHKKPNGWVYVNAVKQCCISISTAVVENDIFDRIGNFDESLPACEDYDFWLRATHQYEVRLIPMPLTIKDGGRKDQLSMIWGLDRYRIRSLGKILSSGHLNWADYEWTYAQMKKKCLVYIKGAKKRGKIKEVAVFMDLINQYQPL